MLEVHVPYELCEMDMKYGLYRVNRFDFEHVTSRKSNEKNIFNIQSIA